MLKLWLILFATIVTFVVPAIGASPPGSPGQLETQAVPAQTPPPEPLALTQIQEKLRTLEQSVSQQKEVVQIIIETHDKRLSDFGTLAIMQGTQTTWVGNLVALVSAGIAVLILVGGLIIHLSVKSRAQTQARRVAQQWFVQNTRKLKSQIHALQQEVEKARSTLANPPAATLSGAEQQAPAPPAPKPLEEASQSDSASKDAAAPDHPAALPPSPGNAQAAPQADAPNAPDVPDAPTHVPTQASFVQTETHHTLREGGEEEIIVLAGLAPHVSKIESLDVRAQLARVLVNKGVRLDALGKFEEAIAVYDEIDRRFGKDESPAVHEEVARGLFNKGFRLGALGKCQEAIAMYDEIDRRFGKKESAAARTLVAQALSQAAYTQVICAKQHWHEPRKRGKLLAASCEGLKRALLMGSEQDRATLLGSLGYSLFLYGLQDAALEPTRECLKLGGQSSLDALGSTAQLHRVEPKDTAYEELLAGVALERIEAGQPLTPWIAFQ